MGNFLIISISFSGFSFFFYFLLVWAELFFWVLRVFLVGRGLVSLQEGLLSLQEGFLFCFALVYYLFRCVSMSGLLGFF